MEIVSSLIQNGPSGFHQWLTEMLQAIQDINDTIEQMDPSAIRMFIRGITDFVAECAAMDNFREKVLSELQRAMTYVKNMTCTDGALLGTSLTGVVVGGIFGIVIAVGATAVGATAGAVSGGCVLFGASKIGTKWTGYRLNTKRVIKTVGVVSAASAIGGVVCFALGAAISGPVLLGSVVGLALTGGAAVIGYLADRCDVNTNEKEAMRRRIDQLQQRIDQFENEREEMRRRMDQLENEKEKMRTEIEEMKNEREKMRTEIKEMKTEREEMRNVMKKMKDEMKNEREKMRNDRKEMKNVMEKMKDEMKNDRKEMKNVMTKMKDEMKKDRNEMKDEMKNVMEEMRRLMHAE